MSPSIRIVAVVIAAISFVVAPVSREDQEATGRRETLVRFDQTREFQECKGILSTASTSSKDLTRDGFVSLLQEVSRRELESRLENLPLERSCFFNMHACRNGRHCIGIEANISISNSEERDFLCFTLASMLRQTIGE